MINFLYGQSKYLIKMKFDRIFTPNARTPIILLGQCIYATSIKNNEIEGRSRDGRAKKYTNKICRDNHVHYTSLRLLFSIMATICLLTIIHWCNPRN